MPAICELNTCANDSPQQREKQREQIHRARAKDNLTGEYNLREGLKCNSIVKWVAG